MPDGHTTPHNAAKNEHHDGYPGKRLGFNTYRCTAPWCWARYSPERWWHRLLGVVGRNPFDEVPRG